MNAALFSIVNVGVGAAIAWMLAHWVLPLLFDAPQSRTRAFKVTAIFTAAALVRNFVIYSVWEG